MLLLDDGNSSMSINSWNNTTDYWDISISTDDLADTEGSSIFSHPSYKLSHYIWFFGFPVVLVVGNFGNIMTIVIMGRQKSGEAVVNIYFTALAIVDSVALDVVFLNEWIGNAFGYFITVQHDFLCKVHNWTGGTTTVVGAWFLVCLTAHRAVSVVWPHRVNALCTRRLVARLLWGITIFFGVVFSHYLYGYQVSYFEETNEYVCIMLPESYAMFVQEVFTFIYLAIYCLIPFSCIIFANSVLVWKLKSTVQEVRHQFAEKEHVAAREKSARSVTLTIITVSVAFVVLTLPVMVYFISFFIFDYSASTSVEDHARAYLIRAVTFLLNYSNHAINFYIYCLTGAKFRKEFVNMFCSRASKHT